MTSVSTMAGDSSSGDSTPSVSPRPTNIQLPTNAPAASPYGNAQLRVRASPIAGRQYAGGAMSYLHVRANEVTSSPSSGQPSSASPTPSPPVSSHMHARPAAGHHQQMQQQQHQYGNGNYSSYPESTSKPGTPPGTPSTSDLESSPVRAPHSVPSATTPQHSPRSREHPRAMASGGMSPGLRTGSPPIAARAGSPLLFHLLFFVAGMLFAYVLVTTTYPSSTFSESTSHATALMHDFKQGPVHAAITTEPAENSALAAAPAELPLCDANGHADGEWVFDESITSPPYKSNEWDNVCDARDAKQNDGQPYPAGFPRTIRPELRWVWKPRQCRLLPYSRENFCRLLNRRNILFVGDSIAGQHASSFIHLMSSEPNNLWIRDEYFRHDVMSVCQDIYPLDTSKSNEATRAGRHPNGKPLAGIRVGFKRNNFLNLHTVYNATQDPVEYRKWNTNQTWVGEIDAHQYDIVVMNTGIWMVDAPVYDAMLSGIAAHMREHHPKVTLVWRSTQPGHAHCHEFWARPQSRLYDIRDTTGGAARFRWEEADERNRIARKHFPNEYFDVVTPTKLRPDGHMPGECLHYCQPGPVDEWHKLLYHRLALQRPEFIQQLELESKAKATQ